MPTVLVYRQGKEWKQGGSLPYYSSHLNLVETEERENGSKATRSFFEILGEAFLWGAKDLKVLVVDIHRANNLYICFPTPYWQSAYTTLLTT
jgi:hypothetical protein